MTASAAHAAQRIRDGALSSEELVQACLEHIRSLEPKVKAWTFLAEEHALAQARAADERKRSGEPVGPLHGVPVGLKDIIDTADMPTENGTVLHKGRTPRRDAAVPLALGSQTNGSVIRPASFCGVYGFKPTHGLIPRTGILPLSRTLDHVGIFARDIDDLALLAEQLVGYDEGDPDTRPRARIPFQQLASEEPPIPPVLAFMKTPQWERADQDTKDAFGELREALGDRVEEVELFPSATEAWDWHKTIMEAEMAANLEREWRSGKNKLSEKLRSLIERGREVRAVDYQRALRSIAPAAASFDDLFMQRYDAILTPAALGTAPKGLGSTGDPVFCTLWTLTGLPAISLPLMQGANGLPLGVQLVGRRNFDARLLRTARWLVEKLS
jgi:Asp-tRNA(Asn)/Glu-tRNA(Gln) amidotransferase A subunit family amidase